jgi:hypothetical protein
MANRLLLSALAIGILAGPAVAVPARVDAAPRAPAHKVAVALIAEDASIEPGTPFWVGLRQRIAPVWHTYWSNPGDSTNTPHMYVVDKAGTLVYAGAIDDRPTTRRADVPGANNYVRAALESMGAGQPVKTPVTRAYGCTIKYS